MLRSTSALLVTVMLLASGRLLACGWECMDEVTAPAAASCHTESAPVVALNGEAAHPCLPDVAEPRVTVAKPASAQALAAAPLLTTLIFTDGPAHPSGPGRQAFQLRFESPHSPAPTILRI